MLTMLGCGKTVKKSHKLISYESSSGGGMEGGGRSTEVRISDGEVILAESVQKMWYTDEEVREYRVDAQILQEIEAVFRRYHINRWHGKRFTKMFIADGESYSYSFDFEGNESIYFSSQYYPARYRNILGRFDVILDRYRTEGELLPGLVTEELSEEDVFGKIRPEDGKVSAEVFGYSHNGLRFRLKNGTGEPVSVSGTVRILRDRDGAVLYESLSDEPYSLDPNSSSEDTAAPEKRLEPGRYTLEAGELSCSFEIALPSE